MSEIHILDEKTIDQIAAGEVVDRPVNVVKELVENAIDSGADSINVEIKEGGIKLIRVSDNGIGIPKSEIKKAFLRHATSKIIDANDLLSISSLGFRGEALSSICAVSSVEVITKEKQNLTGLRYVIEGSKEIELSDIGAPDGTTIIVRDLFFNVPVRKKFLKSPATEGGYIAEMMEHLALSHPEIAINFIMNGRVIFSTSGSNDIKEVIYRIYGKDIKDRLLSINTSNEYITINGFILKPEINKSNRSFENFFINGRYVQCDIVSKAVEEGYKNFLMQHKFPFVFLYLSINPKDIDVNVHPSKMMIRLNNQEKIYGIIVELIKNTLSQTELIPEILLEKEKNDSVIMPKIEPFETTRKNMESNSAPLKIKRPVFEDFVEIIHTENPSNITHDLDKKNTSDSSVTFDDSTESLKRNIIISSETDTSNNNSYDVYSDDNISDNLDRTDIDYQTNEQMNLFNDKFLSENSKEHYQILGQIFKTYWLIAFEDKLYFMDQHAAHEKVKYESLIHNLKNKTISTQQLNPPIIVSLSPKEEAVISENLIYFEKLGFEIEDFGLGSVAIRGIPTDLYGCDENTFFREILDELMENSSKRNPDVILDKLASMACKAAVKGNSKMSVPEVKALLDQLLTLDNPYNCPHGRPTIFSMSKYEIEKKFKRITD